MREFYEGLWSIEWNSIRPERTFGPFLKMHVMVVDHWILWWEITLDPQGRRSHLDLQADGKTFKSLNTQS